MWGRLGMLALALATMMAAPASAQVRYIPTGVQVQGPYGWDGFCSRFARKQDMACMPQGPSLAYVEFSHANMQFLRSIREFYSEPRFSYPQDIELYGEEEFWTYLQDPKGGDCEDFVLTWRRELLRKGWPSSALLIMVVSAWNPKKGVNEGHAVLVVRTSEGDLVLDPLRADVHWWQNSGHRFINMQSQVNPMIWLEVVLPPPQAGTTAAMPPLEPPTAPKASRKRGDWRSEVFQNTR